MNEYVIWIAGPLIGFIGMMSGGYWGIGCGWIVVPTMLILGFDPLTAVGIGLLQMAPATLPTVIRQLPEIGWGSRQPGWTLAFPIAIGALLTSLTGKPINRCLLDYFGSARPLQWLLVIVILIMALQTLCTRTAVDASEMPVIGLRRQTAAFATGLGTGVLSSLLGIGGGMVIRPLLTSIFRTPEYYTSRIVRLLVQTTSTVGGLSYVFHSGRLDWTILTAAALTAAGGLAGFPLGVRMHEIVFRAGYAQHIHKSFALIAAAVLINTLLNLAGYNLLSRYLMLAIAVGLGLYLWRFTVYAGNHVIRSS